jgi:hypothetical protein
MNNFAILISCTAEVLTPFLELALTNITLLIYQEKVSQQCTAIQHTLIGMHWTL